MVYKPLLVVLFFCCAINIAVATTPSVGFKRHISKNAKRAAKIREVAGVSRKVDKIEAYVTKVEARIKRIEAEEARLDARN
jgi:hypothetical protein